ERRARRSSRAACRSPRPGGWRSASGAWRCASGPRRARPGRLAPGCQPIDGGPSFVAGGALLELTGQFWGAPFLRHDDKRQRILAAATAVFAERDFHRVLVSEVASRAGVGKGTVYLYFPTKDDLHRGALEASLERLAAEVELAAEAAAPPDTVLEEIVLRILRFFWRRPHLLTLVQRYEQRYERAARERRQRVRQAIERVPAP